jgi:hypothetical protein
MDSYFDSLASFACKIERDCKDMTDTMTTTPLSIKSGHQINIINEYLDQSATLRHDTVKLTTKSPNANSSFDVVQFASLAEKMFELVSADRIASKRIVTDYIVSDFHTISRPRA